MKPITFSCEATLPLAPEGIASQILDLANWPDFTGFSFVPGIKTAEFEVRTVLLTAFGDAADSAVERTPSTARVRMFRVPP